jgi:aromatic-L-amino-acid decarboxylase
MYICYFYRLKGSDEINEALNKKINDNGKINVTPCHVNGKFILRFAVCSRLTESEDIQLAYDEISKISSDILSIQ